MLSTCSHVLTAPCPADARVRFETIETEVHNELVSPPLMRPDNAAAGASHVLACTYASTCLHITSLQACARHTPLAECSHTVF